MMSVAGGDFFFTPESDLGRCDWYIILVWAMMAFISQRITHLALDGLARPRDYEDYVSSGDLMTKLVQVVVHPWFP